MVLVAGSVLSLLAPHALSQDKKPPAPKMPPRAVLVAPLGAIPGKPAKLTLIGLRLDTATAVRFADPKAKPAVVKMLNKKKMAPNQKQDANRIGDSHVEIELTLAAETMESSVALVVETPDGVSNSVRLMVDKEGAITPEKEPNNGFAQSQPVQIGTVIAGSISQGQDVDVFRFEGKEGQRVVFDVVAARYGSALEPMLTLYDAAGRIIATSEEGGERSDARIDIKLPKAGTYHLSLIDAHDQGGLAYVYRLMVGAE
jgi:hypothetical protein